MKKAQVQAPAKAPAAPAAPVNPAAAPKKAVIATAAPVKGASASPPKAAAAPAPANKTTASPPKAAAAPAPKAAAKPAPVKAPAKPATTPQTKPAAPPKAAAKPKPASAAAPAKKPTPGDSKSPPLTKQRTGKQERKQNKERLSDLQSFLGAPPPEVTKFQKMSLKELEKVSPEDHMVAIKWYMMNQAAKTYMTWTKEEVRVRLSKERPELIKQLREEIKREVREAVSSSRSPPQMPPQRTFVTPAPIVYQPTTIDPEPSRPKEVTIKSPAQPNQIRKQPSYLQPTLTTMIKDTTRPESIKHNLDDLEYLRDVEYAHFDGLSQSLRQRVDMRSNIPSNSGSPTARRGTYQPVRGDHQRQGSDQGGALTNRSSTKKTPITTPIKVVQANNKFKKNVGIKIYQSSTNTAHEGGSPSPGAPSGPQSSRGGKHNFVDSSNSPKGSFAQGRDRSKSPATARMMAAEKDIEPIPINESPRMSKYQRRQTNNKIAQVVENKIEKTRAERNDLLRQEHQVRGNALPNSVVQGLAKAKEQSRQKTPITQPIRSEDESQGPNWDYRVTAKDANQPFTQYELETQKREMQRMKTIAGPKRARMNQETARDSPRRINTYGTIRDGSGSPSPSAVDNSKRPKMIASAQQNSFARTYTPGQGRPAQNIQVLDQHTKPFNDGLLDEEVLQREQEEIRKSVSVPKNYSPPHNALNRYFQKKDSVDHLVTESDADMSHKL